MKYARIIEALIATRWMITPEMHRTLCGLVKSKLGESFAQKLENQHMADRGKNVFGDDWGEIESMTVSDGVATIPIVGVMANKVGMIEKSCGVTDYKDIIKDLDEVRSDKRIKAAVLKMDTPGGTVAGCYEAADAVEALSKDKRVVAFTDGMICSAGYYLAAPCSAIVTTKSSMVGSIGCILQLLDDTEAWAMFGYKVETFRSDELKAAGASGTSLSEAQRAHFQEMVDESANRFKNWVSYHRSMGVGQAMDGRVFSAEQAVAEGLTDRLVASIADAVELVK